jgi:hypothetical protein
MSEPKDMSRATATLLSAGLVLALLAGVVALGLAFKAADDAQQAVRITATGTAGSAGGGAPSSTPANPDTAMIGVWQAPRVPIIGLQLTPSVSLLALATVAGFIGAVSHTLTVLTSRKRRPFGLWWYVAGPVTGAALALLFFAAVHVGLLASSGSNDAALNLYGVVALGGVAGLFARKANEQLAVLLSGVSEAKPTSTDRPSDKHQEGRHPSGGAPDGQSLDDGGDRQQGDVGDTTGTLGGKPASVSVSQAAETRHRSGGDQMLGT